MSFQKEVWDTLSHIDVSDHVESYSVKKGAVTVSYLAWHRAWALLKEHFPASTYNHGKDIYHPDGTVEVEVEVGIRNDFADDVDCLTTNARLAVMDNYWNAIANPTARQINDNRQRALVKALAFAGLGLNLWGDSSIPVGELNEPIDIEAVALLSGLIEKSGTDEAQFLKWAGVDALADLPKSRLTSARKLLETKVRRAKK
jgi:hypothetical protein